MKDTLVTLAVVLAAGAFLLWGASYYTVFDDEAFSLQRYVLPAGELVSVLRAGAEPDPPLFYLLQRAWIDAFGVRPVALRGPAVLMFLAALPVIRAAGAAWGDERAGRWALVLCGLHPLHLFFGFAARWYSLAFLCAALLLLASAKIERRGGGRRWFILWTTAAMAALYTNYFAACLVGALWLRGVWVSPALRRPWRYAAAAVLAAYLPWVSAFADQLGRFPRAAADAMPYLACAGRTGAALLTGNLAAPAAWYVWMGMAVFVAGGAVLFLDDLRRRGGADRPSGGPAWAAAVCLAAGVATLTMIDKYAMAFSAPVWLATGLTFARSRLGRWRAVRSAAVGGLCVGWAGCGLNWAMERNWSSQRWLDPFAAVVREHVYSKLVATHPSVRYYYGIMDPADWYGRVEPQRWRARAAEVLTPRAAAERWAGAPPESQPRRMCAIQGAATASDAAEWEALFDRLRDDWTLASEDQRLADPAAALKDRLDPGYVHPPWRVVTRCYVPRIDAGASPGARLE